MTARKTSNIRKNASSVDAVRPLTIFVSSPSDVGREREAVDQVVRELNKTIAKHHGVVMYVWSDRDAVGGLGEPQSVIDEQLPDYDIMLGIMWRRFGTPTSTAGSGTEQEFNDAYRQWQENRSAGKCIKPRVLFYFCERPFFSKSQEEDEQFAKVRQFRKRIEQLALFHTFETTDSFTESIRSALVNIILEECSEEVTGRPVGRRRRPPGPETGEYMPPPTEARHIRESILSDNPVEKISGRQVILGLSESEIDYIVRYMVEHNFNIDRSWASQRDFKRQFRSLYPQRPCQTSHPFLLSRYPVTNRQFAVFVDATGYKTTAERQDSPKTWRTFLKRGDKHPVTCVSFKDAMAFCSWARVRLPTSEEFERAVRGSDQRLFPWGDEWSKGCCNDVYWMGDDTTSEVGAFRTYTSADGIDDLSGNVFEWVIATDPEPGMQMVAGGAFDKSVVVYGNAAARRPAQLEIAMENIGFRFAADI